MTTVTATRPHPSSSASVESALLQAVADLQIRSEIQTCLAELVTDAEIAVNLQERMSHAQTVSQLQSRVRQQERALEEARAVQNSKFEFQGTLADELVRELWGLSQELGSLQELKQHHEKLVIDYNEVSARLFQTEEDLREVLEQATTARLRSTSVGETVTATAKVSTSTDANDVSPTPQSPATTTATTTVESDSKVPEQKKDPVSKETELQKEESATSTAEVVDADAAIVASSQQSQDEQEKVAATDNATTTTTPETSATTIAVLEPTALASASAAAAAAGAVVVTVALDDDDKEQDPPRLHDLDTEIIMHVFGYLDALDILNTAQVNISMYSRVDSLFGLGGGGPDAEDNSTIASTETPLTAASTAPSRSTTATVATMSALPPPATKPTPPALTTASSTTTKTTTTNTFTIPAPPPTTNTARASNTSAAASSSVMPRGPGGIFSMLQQGMPKAKASPSSPSRGGSGSMHGIKKTYSQDGPQPMNAAMANSMAAKLTDGELNAIILMTERLKQKESLADKLVKENAALSAKLDGTEAVKQFLIAKVRDMEVVQATQEENETKVAQQIGSDQEVIAFLDGRVQELEAVVKVLEGEKANALSDLEMVKKQSEKKAVVMGDMLQYERERLSESERDWKATKKVLVKEVKMNRAQILALQAERDGYREQNEVLRRAVLSSGGGNASPSYISRKDRAYTYDK